MRALQALSEHLATKGDGSAYGALRDGGARFCALKPDTAAYVNAVHWLLAGLDERSAPADIAATVARRVEAYTAHRRLSLDRIRDQACRLLPVRGNVLIHDYSSTVLAVIAEAGQRGLWLRVYVTAGAPHMRA
jgi:translation initiation factor 2B subunit (eIF-2B alpha/beta/delta family)